MIRRSDIVGVVQSYLGVPWRHMGHSRKACDCVGLIYAVASELECIAPGFTMPRYGRQPDGSLLSYFDAHMDRVPATQRLPGTVLIYSHWGLPYHSGILYDPERNAIIHSSARARGVCIEMLDQVAGDQEVLRAYDYKGVANG